MDFNRLKKAAKETFLKVSSKIDEFAESDTKAKQTASVSKKEEDVEKEVPKEENIELHKDSEEDIDEILGQTQRVDLKDMIGIFKKKVYENNESENKEPVDNNIKLNDDPTTKQSTSFDLNKTSVISEDLINEIKESINNLDKKINEVYISKDTALSDINNELISINEEIAVLCRNTQQTDRQQSDIFDRVNETEKKLNNITASMSSVSKLNDSIFDLKNSQMNTKNSIGELEASFFKLKRKMSTSVLIISILTAIIAALEIINLLS